MRAGPWWVVLGLGLVACSGGKAPLPTDGTDAVDPGDDDDDDNTSTTWTTSSSTSSTGPTSTSVPDGPRILSLSTNVNRITEYDSFRISAIVTDPDGIDDLIGGELLNEDGASLATFATGAQEGAYEVSVSWEDIDRSSPIEIYGDEQVPLLARFYDVAGHTAQSIVDITLYCDEGAACDGHCLDVQFDPENCGTCGTVCPLMPTLGAGLCGQGTCIAESSCVATGNVTCDDVCANDGLGPCVELYDGYGGTAAGVSLEAPQCSEFYGWYVPDCTTRVDFVEQSGAQVRSAFCFCEQ
ncbi:MAG: hypothetical protein R3F59_27040 [Myxococcota bacterium]